MAFSRERRKAYLLEVYWIYLGYFHYRTVRLSWMKVMVNIALAAVLVALGAEFFTGDVLFVERLAYSIGVVCMGLPMGWWVRSDFVALRKLL